MDALKRTLYSNAGERQQFAPPNICIIAQPESSDSQKSQNSIELVDHTRIITRCLQREAKMPDLRKKSVDSIKSFVWRITPSAPRAHGVQSGKNM